MTSSAEPAAAASVPETPVMAQGPRSRHVHIAPTRGWLTLNLSELWAYRGLFFFLVWRDVKVRYAQTVLGATWAVLQPVFSMVVISAVFGRLVRVPSEGVPYPVFALSGIVAWNYFAGALGGASNSLVSNSGLITKVYFPRLVIPGAAALAALVDFMIAFVVLLLVMLGFGLLPSLWAVLVLPIMLLLMMMTALGTGCWLAALNIQYRDVRHLTGFLIQMWMYASPIVYPLSVVPQAYRPLYTLNPMASAISGFRAALLGTHGPSMMEIAIAFGSATILLLSGVLYFHRTERGFADVA